MKALLLFVFLCADLCLAQSESASSPAKNPAKSGEEAHFPDQSRKAQKAESKPKAGKMEGPVARQIKKTFQSFLKILEKESVRSSEYAKASRFLENSLYNEASFESLKALAGVYESKKDYKNQINVLKILSSKYPKEPESFYLLGEAYKSSRDSGDYEDKESRERLKELSIESLNKAVELDKKYILAYEALLAWLMREDPKTGEKIHTKDSLLTVMDMLKSLRLVKYYSQLCKAYYDNKFLKQSRRACAKSIKRNPKDPMGYLMLALSLPDAGKAKKEKKILSIAEKFKDSFFVQYKTALYFMDKDSKQAVAHFNSAFRLQPENMELNKIMSHFLFDNDEEERSYKNFLKACHLTEGLFLNDFRLAARELKRKQKPLLIPKFQKGIEECLLLAREKKRAMRKKP